MSSDVIDSKEVDISTIAENQLKECTNSAIGSPKIRKLKELFEKGYSYNNIAWC